MVRQRRRTAHTMSRLQPARLAPDPARLRSRPPLLPLAPCCYLDQVVLLTGAPASAAPADPAPLQTRSADPTTAPIRAASRNSPQDWRDSPGTIYNPTPPASSRPKLNSGQIAGIVIGAVAGVLLITSLIVAGALRYKKHRAGWRKDDLNGQHSLDAAFGVSPVPSGAVPTHTAAAAEAGLGHTGSSLQYPHSPYSANGIEMQHSGDRVAHI